ncbi:MAG: energy transducer TonB [Sphingomicrobium sp.]
MMSILLAVAANVVAATPSVELPWFSFDDYPLDAIRAEAEGTSEFEVVIAPNGSPVSCAITRSSGQKLLDRRACEVAMRRARFSPARNAGLQPVYGAYRSQIQWTIDLDTWRQVGPAPMWQITLNRLPAGGRFPMYVEYAVEVDSAGRATNCAPVLPDFPTLATSSCAMLLKDLPAMPLATTNGNVPGVRSLWVAYST